MFEGGAEVEEGLKNKNGRRRIVGAKFDEWGKVKRG